MQNAQAKEPPATDETPAAASGDPASLLEALHCLRVAVTIFDKDDRLIFASRHLNHLLHGLPPAESLPGISYAQLVRLELPMIAPLALAGGHDAFIAARLTQLETGAFEPVDVPLADGRIIEIKARRHAQGAVLLWTDVTQPRHQFARLQAAIRLSADAFAFYDDHDRFLTGNHLYAQFVGQSLAELQGKPFETVVREMVANGRVAIDVAEEDWIGRWLRGHRQQSSADTMQTAWGTAFLVRDSATPDGGRAVVFTDITEKNRAEEALAQTRRALADSRDQALRQTGYLADLTRQLNQASAQADNAKTTLLRTMSHELKTPLNAILGFSDLMASLADNLSPAQIREYAGLVHQGGTNLLKILTQIMDLTKISAGRYDLRALPVDAGGLLWQAREGFLPRAESKGIVIDADACPIGLMARADETVLTGMIAALIDNAVTFTQQGGAVRLAAVACAEGVRISVEDNGPGVAAKDLDRILEPFEQAGRVGEHAKGAGLGLTLVKAFAELHGGRLLLESVSGEGFAASILLPAA